MPWIIRNANLHRWGTETFPTREAAAQELREFWKGVSGVKLDRFYIEELLEAEAAANSVGEGLT